MSNNVAQKENQKYNEQRDYDIAEKKELGNGEEK